MLDAKFNAKFNLKSPAKVTTGYFHRPFRRPAITFNAPIYQWTVLFLSKKLNDHRLEEKPFAMIVKGHRRSLRSVCCGLPGRAVRTAANTRPSPGDNLLTAPLSVLIRALLELASASSSNAPAADIAACENNDRMCWFYIFSSVCKKSERISDFFRPNSPSYFRTELISLFTFRNQFSGCTVRPLLIIGPFYSVNSFGQKFSWFHTVH